MALLIALTACHHAVAPAKPPKIRLVVLIVVDQLPSWMFDKQRPLFKYGLARLLRDGGYVPAAEIPYANTFTGPGHAAIGTGAPPSVTGVVGNQWYRRAESRERGAEYDPDSPVLSVGAPEGKDAITPELGASAAALRVDGIADRLRQATGGQAHSVTIALKARAACLVAGRRPDLAIWYEPAAGGMTTSRAYADEPPPWLVQLARDHPASRYFGSTWNARDPALLARATGIPDDAPGEGGEHGFTAAFPHALASTDAPEKALVMTPFGDELVMSTVAVALDAMELGRDDVPDLLAVSFGSHDFVGHSFGPDSWEELDLTLRLDAALGQLFDTLDARLGKSGWAVVLTSDHGATPLPERARLRFARRIPAQEVEHAAEAAVDSRLGPGPWISKLSSDFLYFAPAFAAVPAITRDDALDHAARAIRDIPGIAVAGRSDRFTAGCDAYKDLDRAICLAVVPDLAGELYAYPAQGSLIGDGPHGTNHDAPFDDNRRVPILVMAPGLAPQTGAGSLLQVAPTVAALLGIPPPAAAKAKPLFNLH